MSADSCADSGGSFDYSDLQCDQTTNHRFVSYGERTHTRYRECRLVSRNGNRFHRFGVLEQWIARQLRVENAILDGEIVCPDEAGRSIFKDVLFRRGQCRLFAFDLLWLDGEDLRGLSLIERKARLKQLIGRKRSALLYVDHIEDQGRAVFEQACRLDLEGIVAKPKEAIYLAEMKKPAWIKIKNPFYSQKEGRQELFERYRLCIDRMKVLKTITDRSGKRRVEIYQRSDGFFGFEVWQYGPEEKCWYPEGRYSLALVDTLENAEQEARSRVQWLCDEPTET